MAIQNKQKEAYDCTCERCGYNWEAEKQSPVICPKCQSRLWNTPRKNKALAKSNAVDNSDEGITKKEGGEILIPNGVSSPSNSQNKANTDDFLEVDEEELEEEKNTPQSDNPADYEYCCSKCKELFNKKGNEAGNGQVRCPDCKEIYDE